MNVKGFRRILFGERMPDKNASENIERYLREVDAGRKFAKFIKIDKLAYRIQMFATYHRRLCLLLLFSLMAFCFLWNTYRLFYIYRHGKPEVSAVERQDSLLHDKLRSDEKILLNIDSSDYEN